MPNPLDQDPASRRLNEVLDRSRASESTDVDAMWARLRTEAIDAAPPTSVASVPEWASRAHRVRRIGTRLLSLAGTALAAAALYYVARTPSSRPGDQSTYRDYETDRGMRATVDLTDGSRVQLAPQSRLRVPDNFSGGQRRLELRGEAIFDVVHDTLHPFQVIAGTARMTALGTRFDVRAYDPDGSVAVVVANGSVSLDAGGRGTTDTSPVVVAAGMRASLWNGRITLADAGHLEQYFDWERGRLSFERQPLRDVLATIGRWYDLDVSASDTTLLPRQVTAEFSTQRPTAMLEALATAVGAKSVRDGRRVVLTRLPR